MRKMKAAVAALTVLAVTPVFAQNDYQGFTQAKVPTSTVQAVTPETYKALPVESRQSYVLGVIDTEAFLMPQVFVSIKDCVKGANGAQLTTMVDHGLASMPPVAVGSMPQNVHNALNVECKKR